MSVVMKLRTETKGERERSLDWNPIPSRIPYPNSPGLLYSSIEILLSKVLTLCQLHGCLRVLPPEGLSASDWTDRRDIRHPLYDAWQSFLIIRDTLGSPQPAPPPWPYPHACIAPHPSTPLPSPSQTWRKGSCRWKWHKGRNPLKTGKIPGSWPPHPLPYVFLPVSLSVHSSTRQSGWLAFRKTLSRCK